MNVDIAALKASLADPLMARQFALEAEAITEGARRLDAASQEAQGTGGGADTPALRSLLHGALETASAAIQEYVQASLKGRPGPHAKAAQWLHGVDPMQAAISTLRLLLDGIDRPRKVQSVAIKVGHSVFLEIGIIQWAAEHKEYVRAVKRSFKSSSEIHHERVLRAIAARSGADLSMPSDEALYQVGGALIWIVSEHTGFFERQRRNEGAGRNPDYLIPTPKLVEWVKKHNAALAWSRPVQWPLVVPSLPWAHGSNGGYHFALANSLSFVSHVDRETALALRDACGPIPVAAINHLQGTRWRINRQVLEVFHQRVMAGGGSKALPRLREEVIPPHPLSGRRGARGVLWTPEEQALHDRWRKQAASLHEHNARVRRTVFRTVRTLAMAQRLAAEERFFYACQFDFRGRVYYACPDLTPQGSDIHKALLEFAYGDVPSSMGREAMALHGAARLGKCPWTGDDLTRMPLQARVSWITEHTSDIEAVASNPDDHAWWEGADDPWSFLAFCFAWRDTGNGGRSHLCCQIDGTCNGYQHLAALAKDTRLACAVNVVRMGDVPAEDAVPADIYLEVAAAASLILHGDRDTAGLVDVGLGVLDRSLVTNLDRSLVKRPVMTVPYGASEIGITDSIQAKLRSRGSNLPDAELRVQARTIASAIIKALATLYPHVGDVRAFIEELCKAASKAGADLVWTSPSGFLVAQRYRSVEVRRPEVRIAGRVVMQHSIAKRTKALAKHKATLGSAPNFVQSLDAANVHFLAAECAEAKVEIGAIHDCIIFHANDAAFVHRAVRSGFVRTYELAPLEQLQGEMASHVALGMPDRPAVGTCNLGAVHQSPFFFS